MPAKKIIIEPYSPEWPLVFEKLREVYQLHLGNYILDIQHVGSTSVPGLAAKPVLDIDIIIAHKENFTEIVRILHSLGYWHNGNQGITDREAFKRSSENVPFLDVQHVWPAHHLYVCPHDSISLKNHLTLRNYLRQHPEKAKAYETLKKQLAEENPHDISRYIAGKTSFITAIVQEAGFDKNSIEKITHENEIH
jgi:GrpB-like predicted nucleotidyltransferase (UPF0157 family)